MTQRTRAELASDIAAKIDTTGSRGTSGSDMAEVTTNLKDSYVLRNTSSSAPASTPEAALDAFLNTTSGLAYLSVGTASSADWKELVMAAATQTLTNKTLGTPAVTGDIVFTERADHASTPGAGFGYLWVKNTTPSTLIFTNDAGTDTTLGSGGGGGTYTQDDIEDFAAGLFTAGSHSLISYAYDDVGGVVNATVNDDLSQYDNTTSQFITAASAPVASVAGKTGAVALAASDIASGTFADARISESSVAQHQAALSIASTQITGTFGTSNYADESVTLAKMQHIATDSFLGRDTASTGDVEVLSSATALSILGLTNALKSDTTAALTVGYTSTDYNGGTQSSGTYTPSAANGSTQYIVNGGAFTLAPPTASTTIVLHIYNASAGTITTSGFTKVTGDSFTTTNGHEFMCVITRCNSKSVLNVTALQ